MFILKYLIQFADNTELTIWECRTFAASISNPVYIEQIFGSDVVINQK